MDAIIALLPEVTPENIYIYAVIGGFIPPMFWLMFWLREDRSNPEPSRVIIGSFLFGALSAIFAIPFQGLFAALFPTALLITSILIFAFIEEFVKYMSVRLSSLQDQANDEAIDPIIYMITAALGFAAMENTLYLIDYLNSFDLLNSILERGKRFIGATLLHVLSSIMVGISLTLSYGKRKKWRPLFLPLGLGAAMAFHAIFNVLVTGSLGSISESHSVVIAFAFVWFSFFAILITIEFIKAYVKKQKEEDYIERITSNPFGK